MSVSFYVHLSSESTPHDIVETLKLDSTQSQLSSSEICLLVKETLDRDCNDGNKIYTVHSVRPAYAVDSASSDSFTIQQGDDFTAVVSVGIDASKHVKPVSV